MVKLQHAREQRAKEAKAKKVAQVKSPTQRKAIETMVVAPDLEDGGESIGAFVFLPSLWDHGPAMGSYFPP
jgi:hypothetical protein